MGEGAEPDTHLAGGAVGPGVVGEGGKRLRRREVGGRERAIELVRPGGGWGTVFGGEVEKGQATEEVGTVFEGGRLGEVKVEFVERKGGVVGGFEAVKDRAALKGDAGGIFGDGGVGFEETDGHGEVQGEGVAIRPGSGKGEVG